VRGATGAATALRTSWSLSTLQEQTIMNRGRTLLGTEEIYVRTTSGFDQDQKEKRFFERF
jgi:hypothetical protein